MRERKLPGFKLCSRCKQPLGLLSFGVLTRQDGVRYYSSECVACNNASRRGEAGRAWHRDYIQRWRKDHPGGTAARVAQVEAWRAANPDKAREAKRAGRRRRRAAKRHAPGSHTAADVRAQYARQKGRCYWCKAKVGQDYHVDHVVPLCLGGSDNPENIVVACPSCNLSKGAKHPAEFAGQLC